MPEDSSSQGTSESDSDDRIQDQEIVKVAEAISRDLIEKSCDQLDVSTTACLKVSVSIPTVILFV